MVSTKGGVMFPKRARQGLSEYLGSFSQYLPVLQPLGVEVAGQCSPKFPIKITQKESYLCRLYVDSVLSVSVSLASGWTKTEV
jgi:hypothetical protein